MSENFLLATKLLDYNSTSIQSLIKVRYWLKLSEFDRIGAAYDFVRNEILFGYNSEDALSASQILENSYGQCNTKTILLMALLRALGIPCRFHAFTIDKSLQRGIVPELIYPIAPQNIIHSWLELKIEDKWIELEGFILDHQVLKTLQNEFPEQNTLCSYGAGTDCLQNPDIDWRGKATFIQKTGINRDLGVFDSPDDFYRNNRQLSGVRGVMYRLIFRHWMNARVAKMRKGIVPKLPAEAVRFRNRIKDVPVTQSD